MLNLPRRPAEISLALKRDLPGVTDTWVELGASILWRIECEAQYLPYSKSAEDEERIRKLVRSWSLQLAQWLVQCGLGKKEAARVRKIFANIDDRVDAVGMLRRDPAWQQVIDFSAEVYKTPRPHPKEIGMSETVLHKDGDHFAIVTTAEDESLFLQQFTEAISGLIDAGDYNGDWAFQLHGWIGPAFEIMSKHRGYKANVVERRTLIAGHLDPDAQVIMAGRSVAAEAEEVLAEETA